MTEAALTEAAASADRPADSPRRAVLLAAPRDDGPRQAPLRPHPLTTLVDRPFVQHVIEQICGQGVERLDVIGTPGDEALRQFVVDEPRWGCYVGWHEASGDEAYERLRQFQGEPRILLARADTLPLHPLSDPRLRQGAVAAITGVGVRDGWLGWAVLDGEALELAPPDCGRQRFYSWLATLTRHSVPALEVMRCDTYDNLLSAQLRLLQRPADSKVRLIGRLRSQQPALRVCRNVRIHPTARIEGPVFVGDNSRIGKRVRLGPNTAIGPNCVVDHDAVVTRSLVEPGSYVGPWVEAADCVIRRDEVVNVRLHAQLTVDDPLVVSGI